MSTTPQSAGKPWDSVPATGPLLRPAKAASYLGLSETTYRRMVGEDLLPRPVRIGVRATGVPQPWLDAVIAEATR